MNQQFRILLNLNILGSIGLMIWWILFPVLLPIGEAADSFQTLILDSNWVGVNLIGLIACFLLTIGFPSIYLVFRKEFKFYGFIGMLMASAGLIQFTAIQYYETFIWPAAAAVNPELLETSGPLVSGDPALFISLMVSGALLGIGYLLFGISAIKTGKYKQAALWLFMIGAIVFGNGIAFPIRTVGLILFCTGTIWLSINIKKVII